MRALSSALVKGFALLAVGLGATACSGSNPYAKGNANANAQINGTSTQAGLVQQATEPRRLDPTAAANPAAMTPANGAQASLNTPPSSPAGAQQPPPEGLNLAKKPAEGSGEGAANETQKAAEPPPKRISARHVLVQWMGSERAAPSVVRSREQALVLAKEVHRRAIAGEDFARLAVEYSDEPGAGARGGSLGRFGHGQMVGAFEEAAFKLKVGQVSDVIETGFGFHVIQRTE